MSASSKCPHMDLHCDFHLTSMRDSNVHSLQLTARCNLCGKRLKLSRGLAMGASSRGPSIAADTDFLGILIPVIAEGEEPDKEWGFFLSVTKVEA